MAYRSGLILGTVGCWAVILPGCFGTASGARSPMMDSLRLGKTAEPYVIDFGSVDTDFKQTRRLLLVNSSENDLEVDSYSSSCGCTTVTGLPLWLPPGGSETIEISTDLTQEPGAAGTLEMTVDLKSADLTVGMVEVHCAIATQLSQ